ncbi:amino acid adenylation domain-containing protein [Tumebacillus sp. BK434]|uniref:non-ribosomal peptide synthetase n=1 Tax=Tumebacillus sp. BK434 TaxID=2512169 RepID=UPI0010466643|nr:non-ribosomal peptide synthetase [Tumebacillus sp. BK434]TCP59170.1 amino acid adenylation domain-containing protein [Tumebacillus sp. BK434]
MDHNKENILEKRSSLSAAQRELLKRRMRGDATAPAAVKPSGIPRRPAGDIPLSSSQQRVWLLDQLEPGTATYNIPYAVQMTGDLRLDVLERALNEIAARHEALRSVFTAGEADAVQTVLPHLSLTVPLIDLSHLPSAERAAETARLTEEESKRPFDLAHGPLLRATVLQHGADAYTLVLVIHHIIGDGWSFGVLTREMAALYDAFLAGRPSPLPALPVQYGDFAHWQRAWMQGDVLQKQLGYWKEQLGQELTTLHLPTDRPRPAMQTFSGALYDFWLPKELEHRLEALSKAEGATLYMTLLAAFKTLLYRYTMQEDITVGSPIANRNQAEIEGLIGFFVNTLVMRTGVHGELSFRDVLARVKETAVGAFANQDLPFEKLVEELQPERNMSYSPLFQVMFALQNAPVPELKLPGLHLQAQELDSGTSKFDLSLYMMQKDNGLLARFEYNTDLFDRATMERMGEHLHNLLQSILNDAGQKIAVLPLLTPQEASLFAGEWNGPQADFPQDETIYSLFEQQAARTPDAPAILYEQQALTFGELNARANQVARFLQKQGVTPQGLVGISMERTPEMIIGLLGIMKAGAAYVPVDPGYPEERKAYMLADSGVNLLLTQSRVLATLPAHSAQVVCLDTGWAEIAEERTDNLGIALDPSSIWYVLYTSGSTGKPKGVEGPYGAMVNRFQWMWNRYPFATGDVCSQKTSLNFGDSVWEIWGPLLQGVPLVIFSDLTVKDIEQFVPALRSHKVTRIVLVPSLLRALLDTYDDLQQELPDLKFWVCSGEALTVELTQRFQKALPDALLLNLYGSTEVAADVTYYETEQVPQSAVNIPIGRPIANAKLYILDRNLQQVPIGVPGELCAGGAVLARGYYLRPDLTAERFLPNPYGDGRLFKTGDVVRWLPDGNIEFLGRVDNQVKVRGFRIELGEIEAALIQHDAVHSTIVTVREDIPGDKRLVAYSVPHADTEVSAGDLRQFLQNKLPEYMVPSAFVMLDALPLTPSGKVNRVALPAPDAATGQAERPYVAPRTEVEARLAAIWQEVLRLERVSADAHFFELGGHSLLATQILSRVRKAFDVNLPLKLFFETPKLDALADRIEAARREGQSTGEPILPQPRDEYMPMSSSQERLWFFEQFQPGTPTYNIPEVVRIEGAVNLEALQATFDELVRRHENLRTSFHMVDGNPVQKIEPFAPRPLPVIDLQGLPDAERFPRAMELVTELYQKPFTLSDGAPFSLTLLRLSEQDHILSLMMHHIITDGWSMSRIYQETLAMYERFSQGGLSALPELPVQYADYAVWQRDWLNGEGLTDQLTYWREQLQGPLPVLQLPTDRPRPAQQTFRGRSFSFEVPRGLSDELHKLCRQEGVTLYMLLLAAFNTLLSRYSGQQDILLGSPVANRTREEVEGLIGFFVNTLVLRTDLSGEPTFRELLARVKQTTLDAYAHQDVPFERLVEAVKPERSTSHATLVQAVFALLNTPGSALQVEGLKVEMPGMMLTRLGVQKESIDYDLVINMLDNENGLRGVFEYNTDLFDTETMQRMLRHFIALLGAILEAPERKIHEIPFLSDAEQAELLAIGRSSGTLSVQDACLHHSFERQAALTPDATALVAGESRLTYRELNRQANAVAARLQVLGVGPDGLVGIYMDRSADMVTGMLGVLKAGGAYVPLDPAYPQERILYTMEDAKLTVLLTQAHLLGDLPEHGAEKVCLPLTDTDQAVDDNPTSFVTERDLAYVIYTSGSTGRPKGVAIEHRSAATLIEWAKAEYSKQDLSGVLFATSICFDLSVFELFVTLAAGGTVLLAENALHLPDLPARDEVTLINTVPSAIAELLRLQAIPASVRTVNLAGEALPLHLVQKLYRLGTVEKVYNLYGPSEDTTYSTYALIDREEATAPVIGRPLPNTEAYLLDAHLQPVPLGVAGQLFLAGDGLARGYLGRDDLTAEKFIPNPFAAEPGARMYATGDLVRWLPDGTLDYLGRLDHQVKLRGFRIETGEIETLLLRHGAVREALVILREDAPGQASLTAYLVTAPEVETPEPNELRALLKQHLPEYMVPGHFVYLPAFPLSPNGKVDRKRLPAPEQSLGSKQEFVAPRNETEAKLAAIWQELLGIEQVGVQDSFFEIGGHSLIATRMAAVIQAQFGIHVPLKQLFEAVTISELATLIEQVQLTGGQEFEQPGIKAVRRTARKRRS